MREVIRRLKKKASHLGNSVGVAVFEGFPVLGHRPSILELALEPGALAR